MLTHSEIYIIKVVLQKSLCTAKQVIAQIKSLNEDSLSKILLERDLITEDQWNECLDIAKTRDQYPDNFNNIRRDNQILLECFQEHTDLSENLLQLALEESQNQVQTSSTPQRIDEILLKQDHILAQKLSDLGIFEHHPLTCPKCQYTITLVRYYFWHQIPCFFCQDNLIGNFFLEASPEETEALVSNHGDEFSKVISSPRFFFKGVQSSISDNNNISSNGALDSSDRSKPLVGKKLGKYRILAELGRGGMGAVYKAYDPDLDREVALKTILEETAESPEQIRRFQKEARTVAKLSHQNISPLYDFTNFQRIYFFTMAYVEGKDLYEYVREKGRLTEEEALDLMIPTIQAVAYAHKQGVIHRDIKPSNIMIDKKGEPLLMDFGLAKQLDAKETPITKTGALLGTVSYMAPEQAMTNKNLSYSTDLYALGGVLYFLLSGRPPFKGTETMKIIMQVIHENPPKLRELQPEIHPDIEAVVHKCLEKEPKMRYPSAEALLEDLKALKRGHPLSLLAKPLDETKKIQPKIQTPKKSLKKNLILSSTVLLMITLGIWLIFYLYQKSIAEKTKNLIHKRIGKIMLSLRSPLPEEIKDEYASEIIRMKSEYAVKNLIPYLHSSVKGQRLLTIEVLGKLRDRTSKYKGKDSIEWLIDRLEGVLVKNDEKEARALVWALGRLRDGRAYEVVAEKRLEAGQNSSFWEGTKIPFSWLDKKKKMNHSQ